MLLLPGNQASAAGEFFAAEEGGVPGQYIVVLGDGVARGPGDPESAGPSVEEVAGQLAGHYEGRVERVWQHALRGFQLNVDELRAQQLASDPLVKRVRQDRRIESFSSNPLSCYGFDFQSTPAGGEQQLATRAAQAIVCDDPDPRNPNSNCVDNWGLDRIDQTSGIRDGVYNYTFTANGIHVYVLDTGILAEHQEFEEFGPPWTRVIGGYNAILDGDPSNTTDCLGHGTHVAGIIGGAETGVAKSAWLHPVKFYDACTTPTGGNVSDVVNGMDWILANHTDPAVVNWSGGNGSAAGPPASDDPDVQDAARNLIAAGISLVQAAGNQNDSVNGQPVDACSRSLGGKPGLDAVIVAGGTDANQSSDPIDGRWIREVDDPSYSLCTGSFEDCGSNSGTCVDVWAPAAHIVSAAHDDPAGYCRLSGTSMAAPHVTGAVALYIDSHPTATPAEVQQEIVGGSTCGALDGDPVSPYYIGDGSPNLLLNSLLEGGGPAGCNLTISDSFSGNGSLEGRLAEEGNVSWAARLGAVTAGGRVIDSTAIGGVPFDPGSLSGNPTVTLSADVDPSASDWVGVGFSSAAKAPYWSAGQIWVLLRPTGSYVVHSNGTAAPLGSGTIPGSPTKGFHQVELSYDTAAGLVTVLINGTVVVSSQPLSFTPDVQYAGFHMFRAADGGGKVGNFQVSADSTVLISDDFSTVLGGGGAVPLHGRSVDLGAVSWQARPGAVVASGHVTDSAAIGGVPFDPGALVGDSTAVVAADVDPSGSEWVGVGFTDLARKPFWAVGQIWVLLRPQGTYAVHADGTAVLLGSGTIPGAPTNGFHQVELRYETAGDLVTVLINGTAVVSSQALSFTPAIQYAGFHMYRSAEGGGEIDNFQASATLIQ